VYTGNEESSVTGIERVTLSPGVCPTRLILGCAQLGGLYRAITEEEAQATVDEAWCLGVRAFDTAPYYGSGLSEQRLGVALHDRPRDDYVLLTKVGRVLMPRAGDSARAGEEIFKGAPPLEAVKDYSRDGVLRSLGCSLGRLRLDYVDIVHVHDPDTPEELDQAIREAIPALVDLREQGVIGAVSAGMNYAEPLTRIVRETDVDCVMVAGRYTLLDQTAAADLLPVCREMDVKVLAAGVFNSGILCQPKPGAMYDYAPASSAMIERAQRLRAVCARHGVSMLAAAQAFALRDPAVAYVVVGARSPEQVRGVVEGHLTHVPDHLWSELLGPRTTRAVAS
jgi:D-threo-aldose 1-dehydrogenase